MKLNFLKITTDIKAGLKAATIFLLIFILLSSCSATETYVSSSIGICLTYNKNYTVEESNNYLVIKSEKDKIEMIITATDVTDSADKEYLELLNKSQLDIQSGAFESNYNNYVYVLNLFTYLMEGNSYGLTPTWVNKATIGTNDYFAYYSALEGKDKCGYIYETVQDGNLYIFCIYIDDSYDNIFDYSDKVSELLDNIDFVQATQ